MKMLENVIDVTLLRDKHSDLEGPITAQELKLAIKKTPSSNRHVKMGELQIFYNLVGRDHI